MIGKLVARARGTAVIGGRVYRYPRALSLSLPSTCLYAIIAIGLVSPGRKSLIMRLAVGSKAKYVAKEPPVVPPIRGKTRARFPVNLAQIPTPITTAFH